MTATRRRPRRASRGRQHIIAATSVVIARRGVEDTRFADVARQADTSISTLQYLFGSREDLLVAALRHRADQFLSAVREVAAAEADPVARLRAIVRSMLSVNDPWDQARADWAVWVEYWRVASRDDELQAEAVETYRVWHALVADAIAAVGAAPGFDAAGLARNVTAMIDGFGIQFVLDPEHDPRTDAEGAVLDYLAASLGIPSLD